MDDVKQLQEWYSAALAARDKREAFVSALTLEFGSIVVVSLDRVEAYGLPH